MRIAAIGSRHLLSGYSGVERGLAQFAPILAESGYRLTVFGGKAQDNFKGVRSYQGVELKELSHIGGKHLESLSRSALGTVSAIRAGFDLLHFQHQGPGVFCAAARMAGVPSVVTVCGLDWQRKKWRPAAQRAIRSAEQIAAQWADGIAVLSRTIKRYFEDTYGRETTFIPNGMPSRPRPAQLDCLGRFGLQPEGYVLFSARLVPEKGCHDLLAAWETIPTSCKLVIAGTAPDGDIYADRLRRQSNPDRVVFTGQLGPHEMEQVMAACRLFVLPSYLEGMSNALLEALSLSRPVLVSDIAENTELLDGLGATFPTGDVSALRSRLRDLLESPEQRKSQSLDIAHEIARRPTWTDVARMHADLYEAARDSWKRRQKAVTRGSGLAVTGP